jgi:hypothetical protein
MTRRISKISANALYANAATLTSSSNINRNDLGLSIFDSDIFTAANGWVTLNPDTDSWAPGINLVSTTANTTITGNVVFQQDIQVLQRGNNANSALRLGDLSAIGGDLLITTIGSLDLQFTTQNLYTASVDEPGTPDYISNFSNPAYSPQLRAGVGGGTFQTTLPYILGNASSLGSNYTIINTQYGSVRTGSAILNWGDTGEKYAYHTNGTITMVIDIAEACGLEDNQYLPGGAVNPAWKGNYRFDAFSSLFKMKEYHFWDYVNAPNSDTFEYSVNMIPQTNDYTNANYGKYNVSSTVWAAASYHAANLGARWMGIATKIRNLIII